MGGRAKAAKAKKESEAEEEEAEDEEEEEEEDEEEAEESEYDPDEKPKKGRGRPAGKKDSKKRSAKETKADKKKGKKEKDPNKPKRPLSGYFLFMGDERAKVKEEHPDWKTGDIGKELGNRWNNLDATRKKKYTDQAAKGKAQYEKDMEEYNDK